MRPRPESSRTPFGKGFLEDLVIAQKEADKYLQYIRREDFKIRPFKIYLVYQCLMARKQMEVQGESSADETRAFDISSVGVDEQPVRQGSHASPPIGFGGAGMQIIRYPGAIGQAISQCLSAIVTGMSSIKQQGSGWCWQNSIKMVIHASVVVDKLPAGGNAAERRILEAIAAPPLPEAGEPMDLGQLTEVAGSFLPTPEWIRKKDFTKYIFNPRPYTHKKEDDDMCFSWCILRAQNPQGVRKEPGSIELVPDLHRQSPRFKRVRKEAPLGVVQSPFYTYANVADLAEGVSRGILSHVLLPEGVAYPVPLKTSVFEAIEELNGFSFSIFKVGTKELTPYYCSRTQSTTKPHYRLGLLQSTAPVKARNSVFGVIDPDHFNFHFILIHDLVGIEGQVYNHHKYGGRELSKDYREGTSGTLICDNCMAKFSARSKKNTYEEHVRSCIRNEPTQLRLPKVGKNVLKFESFQYTQVQPFVIYADIEAINQPRDPDMSSVSENLTILTDHIPVSWAYQVRAPLFFLLV